MPCPIAKFSRVEEGLGKGGRNGGGRSAKSGGSPVRDLLPGASRLFKSGGGGKGEGVVGQKWRGKGENLKKSRWFCQGGGLLVKGPKGLFGESRKER